METLVCSPISGMALDSDWSNSAWSAADVASESNKGRKIVPSSSCRSPRMSSLMTYGGRRASMGATQGSWASEWYARRGGQRFLGVPRERQREVPMLNGRRH